LEVLDCLLLALADVVVFSVANEGIRNIAKRVLDGLLDAAVANGAFRQDLLYRLNVFPIEMPPLRERKDDILILVRYFVQRYANRAGRNIRSIDGETLDLLQSYDWPGNIRELQNVIERSIILSSTDLFSVDELWLSKSTRPQASRAETLLALHVEPRSEHEMIEAALAETSYFPT
jgi:transcriptional regulator with PAS, ATPase and Fis domain